VRELGVSWPDSLDDELLSARAHQANQRSAKKDQHLLNGIQAQTAVVRAGGETWAKLREWGAERKFLTEKELDIFEVASQIPKRIPSEKQALVLLKALAKLRDEGCTLGEDSGK
jgi:hypothetical protein